MAGFRSLMGRGKKVECAICAKTCFEYEMIVQRQLLVCPDCVDEDGDGQ